MRTTIELTEAQHRALTALATSRGIRGFSPLVQEAVDAYLHDLGDEETARLLTLEGILDEGDAAEVVGRIAASRAAWRTAS